MKLRECPFCGGEASMPETLDRVVCCDRCGCSLRVESRTQAVTAWNRRASDEATKKAREALEQIADSEGDLCHRCEGNGAVYADGKAHLYSEGAPTVACPECCGSGRIRQDAVDIARATLAALKDVE